MEKKIKGLHHSHCKGYHSQLSEWVYFWNQFFSIDYFINCYANASLDYLTWNKSQIRKYINPLILLYIKFDFILLGSLHFLITFHLPCWFFFPNKSLGAWLGLHDTHYFKDKWAFLTILHLLIHGFGIASNLCMPLKIYIFLVIWMVAHQSDLDAQTDSIHLLIHSPNVHNIQN